MQEIDGKYIKQLEQELEEVQRDLQSYQENLKDSIGELSLYDNHPADVGTETFEKSKDLALRDQLRRRYDDIKGAIDRIRRGSYGICLSCGRPIDPDRIAAIPEASRCISCQERTELAGKRDTFDRPIEERVLQVPFARTFLDGKDQTGYDGEDAWQDVAKYGTSETQSDLSEAHLPHSYENMFDGAYEEEGIVEGVDRLIDDDEH